MMRKHIGFLALLTIISCSSPKVITTNLNDLANYESSAQIYALPKSRLIFSVEAVRHTFKPGPYAAFAAKFLGIENVSDKQSENWEITNISINSYSEPDPEHYYSVKSNKPSYVSEKFLELSKSGLIVSPQFLGSFQDNNVEMLTPVEEYHSLDFSVTGFLNDTKKTKPKNVLKGTDENNIPILENQFSAKTLEEKAFETANFIFKIRKRRFKLLAGEYELIPQGEAMATSISELNKLEAAYLTLFTGITTSDTTSNVYTFSPDAGIDLQRKTLFRFSDISGFKPAGEETGTPVILEVQDLETNKILNQLQLPFSSSSYEDILFFRLPDRALAKVLYGSHELLVAELPIYQFGALVPFSVQLPK